MVSAPRSNAVHTCLSLAVCLVAFSTVLVPAVGAPTVSDTPPETQPCSADEYDPPTLDGDWTPAFSDPLANGSLGNWTSGDLVRVGGTGDCSLVVGENRTATLTAAEVDRAGGVLTADVDLGANGSLSLLGANETLLSVSNGELAYADTLTVAAGTDSSEQRLSTGRFVSLAVTVENGTTRVALWDVAETWDGEWDAQFETTTAAGALQVRLDGEAFLDGVAIGTSDDPEAAPTPTETPDNPADNRADPPDEDTDDDAGPSGDGPDEFEYDVREDSQPPSDDDSSGGSDAAMGGFLLLIGGVGYFFAYELALFGEQMDAIGSKTPASEVEPADWNVALTKLISGLLALGGLGLLVGAVL